MWLDVPAGLADARIMRSTLVVSCLLCGQAAAAPSWLDLGLEQQSRVEHVENDFRASATADSTALSMRTLVNVRASHELVFGGVELEDSRTYATASTPLNTTHVDPLELLQAYAGVRRDGLEVRAGRITLDLSTRRVVARNRFRNTINGFTGIDATWTSPGKHTARAFAVVPVTRLPADEDGLASNAVELDEESTDALLWAAYYGSPPLVAGARLELYAIGFHERDGELASRDRQLVTLGARWSRKPARGAVDFDVELLPQVGRSRATTAIDDATDLDHRAWSSHAELGVSPAMPWKPRIAVQHDYASGDHVSSDGTMQRFDPLFGARRFDFGPTGIYGPFARSNIQSPGVRASLAPTPWLDGFVSYRLVWLASSTDAWTAAGVRDSSGESGRFLGEHGEISVRWSPLPIDLSLEAGAAYLRRGHFARFAPDTRRDDAVYAYVQTTLRL